MALLEILLGFIISLIISAIIIYVATKIFREKEGFSTAILAAFIGAIIFAFTSYFLGIGWVAAFIGGLAWLIAIGSLYKIGWFKSFFIVIVIWVIATVVSLILPTVIGPL